MPAYCVCVRQSTCRQRNRARYDPGGEEEETKGKVPEVMADTLNVDSSYNRRLVLTFDLSYLPDDSKMQSSWGQITSLGIKQLHPKPAELKWLGCTCSPVWPQLSIIFFPMCCSPQASYGNISSDICNISQSNRSYENTFLTFIKVLIR